MSHAVENFVHALPQDEQMVHLMLDHVPFSRKPTKPETARISIRIEKAAQELSLGDLAVKVGQEGHSFVPALLNGQGRKSELWVSQQVFCLDFDETIPLEEFEDKCTEFGMFPAFIYTTFNHTPSAHRFRAAFVLDQVIVDIRIRNLITILLMRLFPDCDKACKDSSRLYFGGSNIHLNAIENRISVFQLVDGCLVQLEQKNPANFARDRKRLFEKMGINSCGCEYGVSILDEIYKLEAKLYCPFICKEEYRKSSILTPSSITPFSYSIEWKGEAGEANQKRNTTSPSFFEFESKEKNSRKKLSDSDLVDLKSNCQLLREFHDGVRRLSNPERRLLLSNLRWLRNGLPIYREGLDHFLNTECEDPYPAGDEELLRCAKWYDFKPESCSNCSYSPLCDHGSNLLQKIRLAQNGCRKVEEPKKRISLSEARESLETIMKDALTSLGAGEVGIVQAPCGVGKTEYLLREIYNLNNVCVAFPTHRLAREAHARYQSIHGKSDVVLWPERPRLPEEFQLEVDRRDRSGLSGVREIFQNALNHPDVMVDPAWAGEIEHYLEASVKIHGQHKVFCTHEKALRLMEGKSTPVELFVFDEDPIGNLMQIDSIPIASLQSIQDLLPTLTGFPPEIATLVENSITCPVNVVLVPEKISCSEARIRKGMPTEEQAAILTRLSRCSGYIRPELPFGTNLDEIHYITHRNLSTDYKSLILSATPILPLYTRLYENRLKSWEIPPVTLKGKLFLHRRKSYSKSCIRELGSQFVNQVQGFVDDLNLDGIITFKEQKAENGAESVLKGTSIPILSTFGATEGLDSLGGKRIGVVGTPHLPEFAIRLLVHAAGQNVNGISFKFDPRTVRRHEFEVSLWCLSNDQFVQALEFALVERDLAQAVGRARLIDNDVDVHLFSNYVISGGELWEEQKKAR